ncbi:pseudouridine synthase [Uliginosibacterium gangwonense]|uniref:pseudouridine synthase n=1 Tax=Uliginosibacterium gangwonense TaxID=392736 RepID=UPI00036D8B48|nr:pseudouridine synthase [Uliginosibacterium gangwonense]
MISSPYTPPPRQALEPIHADDYLVVVDKPAGLLSVPGRGEDKADCMASRVQAEFPDALIVHRLDMATSGLLILARGAVMHRALSMAFEQRKVHKRYVARVAGILEAESGEVALPLICDWPNRPRQKVDFELGKPSLTRYRVLARDPHTHTSCVELEPVTGRSHQLRVHMQQLGHPILGDDLYAPPEVRDASSRLMLHAEQLDITHPADGRHMLFRSATPF